jgi:hypothetical protein
MRKIHSDEEKINCLHIDFLKGFLKKHLTFKFFKKLSLLKSVNVVETTIGKASHH